MRTPSWSIGRETDCGIDMSFLALKDHFYLCSSSNKSISPNPLKQHHSLVAKSMHLWDHIHSSHHHIALDNMSWLKMRSQIWKVISHSDFSPLLFYFVVFWYFACSWMVLWSNVWSGITEDSRTWQGNGEYCISKCVTGKHTFLHKNRILEKSWKVLWSKKKITISS